MALISKYDQKIWNNYISNFQKSILTPYKTDLDDTENRLIKSNLYKIHNLKNDRNLTKKKGLKPDSTLDLHGYSLYSAKLILHKYLIDCYDKNIRNVLIITGKGKRNKGVLKEEVPKWLNDYALNKLLIGYNVAPKNFGGEGALLLRIRNKYKKYFKNSG